MTFEKRLVFGIGGRSRLLLLSLAWSIVFFGLLWLRDYPRPMVDDLYYTGAALHMAEGGDFSNPLLDRQEFPSHYFFVYPPLHSYALYLWLRIFGISARSMTGFAALMYMIAAFSISFLLSKSRLFGILFWFIPLAISTCLLPAGLRPEALSIALITSGFCVTQSSWGAIRLDFLGFLLMIFGATAAPRLAFFAVALVAYVVLKRLQGFPSKPPLKTMAFVLSLAVFIPLLTMFFQIHFHSAEFWRTFHLHSQLVSKRKMVQFIYYLSSGDYINITPAQLPILYTFLALVLFAFRGCRDEHFQIALFITAGFLAETLVGGLGAGALLFICFSTMHMVSGLDSKPATLQIRLIAVFAVLIVVANAKLFIEEFKDLRGGISHGMGAEAQTARKLLGPDDRDILIDAWTGRYFFDYKIPSECIDIEFSSPFPIPHVNGGIRQNDTYVIGPANVLCLKDFCHIDREVNQWAVLGLPNYRVLVEPRRVYVISAKECLHKN